MRGRQNLLPDDAADFFRRVLDALTGADVPFLVGGAYAFARYTGIKRHTKDFDLFIRRDDLAQTLATVDWPDCRSEITAPHWLAKVHCEGHFVDFVFATGNGVSVVDDGWFERSVEDEILGRDVRLCSAEDVLWTKAFIQERERYDGADVAHLLLRAELAWDLLLDLFGEHWQVLYAHLVLFTYIYPSERARIPGRVMDELGGRMRDMAKPSGTEPPVCRGTLLSRIQYRADIEELGFEDARLGTDVGMSGTDARAWSDAGES